MFKRCLILLTLLLMSQATLAAIVVGNPKGAVTLTEVLDYTMWALSSNAATSELVDGS